MYIGVIRHAYTLFIELPCAFLVRALPPFALGMCSSVVGGRGCYSHWLRSHPWRRRG